MAESKKGICIFIDWYLPGFKAGGPIQSIANLVSQLSNYKTFYIITRNTDYCDSIPYANIEPNTWVNSSHNVHIYYFSEDKITYQSIKNIIVENDFEAIYLNGVFSLKFTLFPLIICKNNNIRNVIVGARGMLAPSALAIKSTKKKIFLLCSKIFKLYKNVKFHATNQVEKGYIESIFGKENQIYIAPNLAKKSTLHTFSKINKTENELCIINIARVAPEKNLLYALQVLKLVKSNIIFNIYGPKYNEPYWQECKTEIDSLGKNITVNYHGAIENNFVTEVIAKNHIMFMPTQGENFGHIILESFQAGRPVLISNLTPWNNLELQNCGFDLPLANKKDFADKIELFAKMSQLDFNDFCTSALEVAQKFTANTADLNANKTLFNVS